MKKARSFFVLAAIGIVLLGVDGTKAFAATPAAKLPTVGQGNGLRISPVNVPLTIEKGGSRQVSVYVENVTGSTLTVTGHKHDFVASDDESGEPKIILDDDQSAPGNSFKTLVGALPTVKLAPGERRETRITLTVPKDAPAGGYYGAIRYAPGTGEEAGKNVSLTASVGTIFLVRVPGNVTEQLKVETFTAKHENNTGSLFNSGPISVLIRFKNSGNVHVQPFGKVSVKNFSGKVIYETEINNTQPRGAVLPSSVRKFEYPITEKKLFGRYTAEGSFGYGSSGELIQARKVFYVIPFKMIAAVIFVLALLIFVIPRLIRAYNRSVIQRAQGARAKPKAKASPGPRSRKK